MSKTLSQKGGSTIVYKEHRGELGQQFLNLGFCFGEIEFIF